MKLDVLIIGAGFAGVAAAIKLREMGIANFRVYDKAGGVGGTWWYNRYPGATCDVPSHFYCYSFEPNPEWSRLYAPAQEIRAYIRHCADKYGILPHLELGREILSLDYDSEKGLWHAAFEDGETVEARFVINGSGVLHRPKFPDFEGAGDFSGVTMHSAAWMPGFDPAGKRIAVVGSAASAIQLVPELAKSAGMVHLFQRTPNYIAPRNDFAYSEEQKERFRTDPEALRAERERLFEDAETRLFPLIVDQGERDKARKLLKLYLGSQVRIKKYRQVLEPDYDVGCKRMLISDNFLSTLNEDNVELVSDPIERLTSDGIMTADGQVRPVDAIVYATGFDIEGHQLSIAVRGEEGRTLADTWADGIQAYKSVMVPGFPNYFMATGPNSGVGTTSVVFMIEQALGWILRCIERAGPDGIVSVSPEAMENYNRSIEERMAGTVWASGCDSWYRSANGRIEILFPGNARAYEAQMASVDADQIQITMPAHGTEGVD